MGEDGLIHWSSRVLCLSCNKVVQIERELSSRNSAWRLVDVEASRM